MYSNAYSEKGPSMSPVSGPGIYSTDCFGIAYFHSKEETFVEFYSATRNALVTELLLSHGHPSMVLSNSTLLEETGSARKIATRLISSTLPPTSRA
jgi:hypothetical protein